MAKKRASSGNPVRSAQTRRPAASNARRKGRTPVAGHEAAGDGAGAVRLAIGCMTGTSIDGLDVALVEISGKGLGMSAGFVAGLSRPLGPIATDLRRLADQQPLPASKIAELMWVLGDLHAEAAHDLAAGHARGERIDLVCVHGQTVYHAAGRTWQLIQPAPIARRLGAPVVYDLRAADVAARGQGAPITPIADWVFFRSDRAARAVVNLGGFCNVTIVPASGGSDASGVRGKDVCACNQLLDGLARVRLGRRFDENGAVAATGKVIPKALAALEEIIRRQATSGRSLGTGDELASWISTTAAQPGADVVRTACEAIARAVADAVERSDEVILAGGGVRNATLVAAIRAAMGAVGAAGDASSGRRVLTTAELGVPIEFREAAAFAVLGALCQDRVPITLPSVTGCPSPAPVAGAWMMAPGT